MNYFNKTLYFNSISIHNKFIINLSSLIKSNTENYTKMKFETLNQS